MATTLLNENEKVYKMNLKNDKKPTNGNWDRVRMKWPYGQQMHVLIIGLVSYGVLRKRR